MKCPFCIKICSKCKRILVANTINFNKKKNGKWGLASKCKECIKKYSKQRYKDNKDKILEYSKQHYEDNKNYYKQWRENNKEYIKEYNKEYNEDNKEYLKEKKKQYYENNKDYIKEKNRQWKEENPKYNKQWYKDNKEYRKEYSKQWRENNPDKVLNRRNKRRQLEENQGNGITKEQWLEMMEFFDWQCAYSGENLSNKRTIDHIIPLSKGGLNEPWNCVPMLRNYNTSKHNKNMEDWYIEQEFFDINRLLKIYEWIEYAWNKWGK